MEKYNIKTRIISAYDYKSVDLSQYVLPFEVDTEKLEQDILLYAKKNAKTVLAEIAENEDIVTFAVKSEIPKFNKPNVTVRLGRNLFNPEIETAIVGMKTGEIKQAEISCGTAEISVKEI